MPTLLARTRLEGRLSVWAPVTIVRAGQGYGKTTLVASWLGGQPARDVTPLWITASPDMVGLDAFNDELDIALDASAIVQPARTNAFGSGALGRLHTSLLAAPLDRRVVLVIDDIWHLPGESVLRSVLSLVHRHPQLHLIACGRGRHSIEAIASATATVNTIATRELALDISEVVELAFVLGHPVSDSEAERLRATTDGRISAITPMLARNAPEPVTRSASPSRWSRVPNLVASSS